jgi:hypothetical protein
MSSALERLEELRQAVREAENAAQAADTELRQSARWPDRVRAELLAYHQPSRPENARPARSISASCSTSWRSLSQ